MRQKQTPMEKRFSIGASTSAGTTGFEPATSGLTGRYANRYTTPPRFPLSPRLSSFSTVRQVVDRGRVQPWPLSLRLSKPRFFPV